MVEIQSNWQFIVAILAIVIPIIIFLIQLRLRRKALSYAIISRTPLLSIQEKSKWNLQIRFDDKPVENVNLIVVKIANSGNEEIRSNDYERPINVDFGESAQVLTAEIVEVNPSSLKPSVKIKGTKIELEPLLLNGGDSIALKMLVSQCSGKTTVDARIAGIKDIKESSEKQTKYIIQTLTGVTVGIAALIVLILLTPPQLTYFLLIWVFFLIYGLLGFVIAINGALHYRKFRKISIYSSV